MDALEAHYHFCQLPVAQQRDLMPRDANFGGGRDLPSAPLWLTAGAILSGMLDECSGLQDLLKAFEHFVSLWDGEVVSDEAWTAAANDVLAALEEASMKFGMALGSKLERNAAFASHELN